VFAVIRNRAGGGTSLRKTRRTMGSSEHLLVIQQYRCAHHRSRRCRNRVKEFRRTTRESRQAPRFPICSNAVSRCSCESCKGQRNYRPSHSRPRARRARSSNPWSRCSSSDTHAGKSRVQDRKNRRRYSGSTRRNTSARRTQRKTGVILLERYSLDQDNAAQCDVWFGGGSLTPRAEHVVSERALMSV